MSPGSDSEPVVVTTRGHVGGRMHHGVAAFLGIGYAAPPTGRAAFESPRPPASWDGIRPAHEYGPTPPQVGYPAPVSEMLENVIVPGDDYLNLNVWTPEPGAAGLPVLVWIHGGAFGRGSNRLGIYDGSTFARDGVVTVGINYRLGVPGFGEVAGAPGNRGLRDQIAALEWVRDNIAAFGGDPGNVTIFGESAGAMSVASLLSSPLAQGLFRRAIMQSGNGITAASPQDAAKVTARVAEILGVPPTLDGLATVSGDALLGAQSKAALELMLNPDPGVWGASTVAIGMGIMGIFPTVDGEVLPEIPVAGIAAGFGAQVPLLAGWNEHEMRFFLTPLGTAEATPEDAVAAQMAASGLDPSTLPARLAAGETPGDVVCEALTRRAFALPTVELARVRPPRTTHLFEFRAQSPVYDIRAGHAVEIPYVFDHLDRAHALVGPHPDQAVADEMHNAWVDFATSGDPGWEPWTAPPAGTDALAAESIRRFG